MIIQFWCPKCKKYQQLELVEDSAIISSPISMNIDTECGELDLETVSVEDSCRSRVQCWACGYIIKNKDEENITDDEDVIEWVKNNQPKNKKK